MAQKQQLYLVFDDWNKGYSIREVPLPPGSGDVAEQPLSSGSSEGEGDGDGDGDGDGAIVKKQPLPGVVLRVQAPRRLPMYLTSAFGTKIMAMHPSVSDSYSDTDIMGIPIIDIQERSFMFGPEPNCPHIPIYFAVGDDKLFALDFGKFNFCLWTPERSGRSWPERSGWDWHGPELSGWEWHELTYPPFEREDVSSYAVRPDGCILVSAKSGAAAAMATFIFDTKEYVWKRYGDWALPFTGRGHYDTSMEAFVGLSKDPETIGYLYSCAMASTGTGDNGNCRLHPSPVCKRSKEKVYNKTPAERHVSATLLHMRPGKFCIVQCVSIGDVRVDQKLRAPGAYDQVEIGEKWDAGGVPQGGRFMYHVMTFSLRYGTNGDLKLKHRRVRCYRLPHEATTDCILEDPLAFWL